MNIRGIMSIILPGVILALVLQGCSSLATTPQPTETTPTTAAPAPTFALATPYAQEPAAGICASFDGPTVTITLEVDAASPRCAEVRSDQTLVVVNRTLNTLQVSIANFSSSILPGANYSIDVPFGDYLAPGVHQLMVTPNLGAELWLKGK